MAKKDIQNWCNENNHVLVDMANVKTHNYLDSNTVKNIASKLCRINPKDISSKLREPKHVFARWLVFHYYFNTGMSFPNVGNICNLSGGAAFSAKKNLSNTFLSGCRLSSKIKFENETNAIHKSIGINEFRYES